MKHLTFLIYTLHTITFSQFIEQPTQEIDKEYHENGSLKCIKTFKDGKQHGETTFYFDT
jgi:antitoxin component YwqK of YwqJK toxin-antitoxin module